MGRHDGARRWLRAAFVLASLLAGVTCTDTPPVTPRRALGPGEARLSLAPRYERAADGAPQIVLARIHGVLAGSYGDTIVKDVLFRGDTALLVFDNLKIIGTSETFTLFITGYDANGVAQFTSEKRYVLKEGDNADLPAPVLVYSAPDAKATKLTVSPGSITLNADAGASLAAAAFGADNAPINPVTVGWTSRDAAVASVDDAGRVTAGKVQRSTYIVAKTYAGLADSTLVKVHAPVGKVSANPATLEIIRGRSGAAAAELRDAAGNLIDDRTPTWSSSDPQVATVSAFGAIQGLKIGTATITASAEGQSAGVSVSVVSPIDHIELTPSSLTLASLSETGAVSARLVPRTGGSVEGIAVTYASSNPAVASVDASGSVTAHGNGSATITATADGVSATADVTVRQVARTVSVSPTSASVSAIGDRAAFAAVVKDARGSQIPSADVAWTSSNTDVATVAGGVATSHAIGSVTLTASVDGASGTGTFIVAQVPRLIVATMNPSSLQVGSDQGILTATIADANGNPIHDASATWTTTTPNLVSISGNRVTPLAAGTAQVTATTSNHITTTLSFAVRAATGGSGGTVTGTVVNAQNNGAPIAGATIASTGSVTSAVDGTFTLGNVVNGGNVTFSAPGFVSATYFGASTSLTSVTSLGAIPLAPVSTSEGFFSGHLVDALTGQGIVGATLSARAGLNATSGSPVRQVTTGAGGSFSAGLPAGTYTISGAATGYIPASATISVVGGSVRENQNIVATPVTTSNMFRIVLTWADLPLDLDSHLIVPGLCDTSCEVNYFHKRVYDPTHQTLLGKLDFDVTSGHGPETITISNQVVGTYHFYVHHYPQDPPDLISRISRSSARVIVYQGLNIIADISAPPNQGCGENDVWSVFDLSGGTVTQINTISSDGSCSNNISSARRQPTPVDQIRGAVQSHPKKP